MIEVSKETRVTIEFASGEVEIKSLISELQLAEEHLAGKEILVEIRQDPFGAVSLVLTACSEVSEYE